VVVPNVVQPAEVVAREDRLPDNLYSGLLFIDHY